MLRLRTFLALLLLLPLAACYSDQKKQLASCEAGAAHGGPGQPLKSIQDCMDRNGYRFVAWDNSGGDAVVCDMASIVRGQPSPDGTDAMCFAPKGWLALKIYHFEVPVKRNPA